eukprot:g6425.t1
MFKDKAKKRNIRSLQIPLMFEEDECNVWQTIAVDLVTLLRQEKECEYKCLRGIKLCANLTVRGVFTSCISYTKNDLPRDMVLSMAQNPSNFNICWIPQKPELPAPKSNPETPSIRKEIRRPRIHLAQKITADSKSRKAVLPIEKPSETRIAELVADRSPSEEDSRTVTPLLSLCFTNGFTGEYTSMMLWVPNSDEIIFAVGSILIAMNSTFYLHLIPVVYRLSIVLELRKQRRFIGHSDSICALSVDDSGTLLASGQEGGNAVIRLWTVQSGDCIAAVQGHESSLIAIDLSPDGSRLVGVGLDDCKRQLVVIWNIAHSSEDFTVQVAYQVTSTANIKNVKWSPYENDRLFTCGRESIRMFRIKDGKLRSMPIHLKHETSPSTFKKTFTCMEFAKLPSLKSERSALLVGVSTGCVYQIDYEKFSIFTIHKLHDSAINCLAMSEGYCAIGSDDCFLRIWPLDFHDYLLQAENDSPVTSVSLSTDGLNICIGTESGALSVLDIVSHTHETVMRSHTDSVNSISLLEPNSQSEDFQFFTGSSDGTLRQWKASMEPPECINPIDRSVTKVMESYFDEEQCLDAAIVDLDKDGEVFHQGDVVTGLVFSEEGDKLFASSDGGMVMVYDAVTTNFRPLKQMTVSNFDDHFVHIALSRDSKIAITYPTEILLLSTTTLKPDFKITTEGKQYEQVEFSSDGKEIWTLVHSPASIDVFDASTGLCLGLLSDFGHPSGLSVFCLDPNRRLYFTGGSNGVLGVWKYPSFDNSKPIKSTQVLQKYYAHSGEIKALKIHSNRLITAGVDASILVWTIEQDFLSPRTQTATLQSSILPEQIADSTNDTQPEVMGLSVELQRNFVWHPITNFFAFVISDRIVVEDLSTKKRRYFTHRVTPISAIAISDDGLMLATANEPSKGNKSCEICIWDLTQDDLTAISLHLHHHLTRIKALVFSHDCIWLVSMSSGTQSNIVVWDVASKSPISVGSVPDPIPVIHFLSNSVSYRFVTISSREISIWDLDLDGLKRSTISIDTYLDNHDEITCCYPHFTGVIYLLSRSGVLLTYSNGMLSIKHPGLIGGSPTVLVLSGPHVVIGTKEGSLEFFEESCKDGGWTSVGCLEMEAEVLSIQMDPCFRDGLVSTKESSIWCISRQDLMASRLLTGIGEKPESFQFCNLESNQISLFYCQESVRIVDLETGKLLQKFELEKICCCARISPDASTVVFGFIDGSVSIYQSSATHSITTGSHSIMNLAISIDNAKIVCLTNEGDVYWIHDEQMQESVRLWDNNEAPCIDSDISRNLELAAFAWEHKFRIYQLSKTPVAILDHSIPHDLQVIY